jgi:uncharacterized protein YdiU (UPF0061 family)
MRYPRRVVRFPSNHTYAQLPSRFFAKVAPTPVARPRLLAWNANLAELLGFSRAAPGEDAVAALAGNRVPEGAEPIALAYAGHQFGGFVPQLGDGRAILLGEVTGRDGRRYDVQLKGAGPTPFSRRGDGRAAIGPVLREYVLSEAMAALGVPTTRALAAVETGDVVHRERPLRGAVLTRVAASHLRIGTFEYFAARKDGEALTLLVDYALDRHYPQASRADGAALALLREVIRAQASLVARWLGLGFVHGVMNTDNMSISGETIDYGPCAFLDAFDRARTFSSIDRHGRYAFANQPAIAGWNLARLADSLVPLVDANLERAVEQLNGCLEEFAGLFEAAYAAVLRQKLGLGSEDAGDFELALDLLGLMEADHVDYTLCFRRLSGLARGDESVAELFRDRERFARWMAQYRGRLAAEKPADVVARMNGANPAFIPRNHRIEQMIAAAESGDLGPFERLNRVLARPYDEQPDEAELGLPPGEEQWAYRTFCGT